MRVVLLGPPGSGKGTQAEKLGNRLNLFHISTGDIIREAVNKRTSVGEQIKDFLNRGELVPDSVVLKLLMGIIKKNEEFILDGFPRNIQQAKQLDAVLGEENKELDLVINLKIDEGAILHRLNGRLTCSQCGKVYHIDNLPSGRRCELCGASLYRRKDDNIDIIKRRINVYKESIFPLIEYYRKKGILHYIQAEMSPEKVFRGIMTLIEKRKNEVMEETWLRKN